MALKVRGGQPVPALQAREPFFDGEKLHIGKLDGSGNQEIGGGGSLPKHYIIPPYWSGVPDEANLAFTIDPSYSAENGSGILLTLKQPGIYCIMEFPYLMDPIYVIIDNPQPGDEYEIINTNGSYHNQDFKLLHNLEPGEVNGIIGCMSPGGNLESTKIICTDDEYLLSFYALEPTDETAIVIIQNAG